MLRRWNALCLWSVCVIYLTVLNLSADAVSDWDFTLTANNGTIKANVPKNTNCSISVRSSVETMLDIFFEILNGDHSDCILQVMNETAEIEKWLSIPDNEVDLYFTCAQYIYGRTFSLLWKATNPLKAQNLLPPNLSKESYAQTSNTVLSTTTSSHNIDQDEAITKYFQWMLGHVSKVQLALIGLGLVFMTILFSCLVMCARKRKRPRKEMALENLDRKPDAEGSQYPGQEQNEEDIKQESVQVVVKEETTKGSNPVLHESKERVYHEINECILKPMDPQNMVELTADGYIKMSRPTNGEVHYPVQDKQESRSRQSATSFSDKRKRYLQRFSSIIHRKRGDHDIERDAAKLPEKNANPLRHWKNMEEYCRKKKQQFVKLSKGKWLQDQNVWSDI